MKNRARATGTMLMTTEKDFVRISPPARVGIHPVPIDAVFENMSGMYLLLSRMGREREAVA